MKTIEFYENGNLLGKTKLKDFSTAEIRNGLARDLNIVKYDQFKIIFNEGDYFDSNNIPKYFTEEMVKSIKDEINNYVQEEKKI